MKYINVTIRMDADELWTDVFATVEYSPPSWLHGLRFVTGGPDKHGLCYVTAEAVDDSDWDTSRGGLKVHRLYIEDIANAYSKLVSDDFEHCNGCGLDDPDACTADALLQQAIYGSIVFG